MSQRVGYACAWWRPREATWSFTASRLRDALPHVTETVDIEAQRTLTGKAVLGALYAVRPRTPWQYAAIERRLLDRAVRRGVRATAPDVVLGIGEVDTPCDVPVYLYQDVNVAAILELERLTGERTTNVLPSSTALLERRAHEQLERARAADAVFVMGGWFGEFLVANGVDPERVVVARAGLNNPPAAHRDPERPAAGRLLFVGVDFRRKGGDLVVEALRRLNREGDRPLHLTVAGPARWPLPGSPPEFVDFRGPVAPDTVARLYATHDAFVMPSRFEAYGIALAEALAAGLPCVARRAYAMPEIVEDGVTGRLVDDETPETLAAAITAVLEDAGMLGRVSERRDAILARHDWRAIAGRMVARMADG